MLPLIALLLASCGDKGSTTPVDSGQESDADTDADADADIDTGTDNDGDGWSVEEGDCDDDDIWVNPAWDEDDSDGKDNDCDGRVDERWQGVDVALQYYAGKSTIVRVDQVSRVADEIQLASGYAPMHLTTGINGGWAFTHDPDPVTAPDYTATLNETAAVVLATESGACTTLVEFEQDDTELAYEEGMAGIDDNPAIRGLITSPKGYYVTATRGALYKVEEDGTTTELGSWNYDFSEDADAFELYAMDLAVDWATGEVAIFGLLGGFATWSEEEGLVQQRRADITSTSWDNWDSSIVKSGTHLDQGGWYSLLVNFSTGEYGIYRFNMDEGSWVERLTWTESLIEPQFIEVNGDNADFYVSANAGDYHMLWLAREQDEQLVDDFYKSDPVDGYFFRGLVSVY